MNLHTAFLLVQIIWTTFAQKLIHLPNLPTFSTPQEINNFNTFYERNPSKQISKPNKETTVQEVEELINSNPTLPRLTRGEILDILENITKNESREKKSLMVVMPFKAPENGGGNSLEYLYTKQPVTEIIDSNRSQAEEGHNLVRINSSQKNSQNFIITTTVKTMKNTENNLNNHKNDDFVRNNPPKRNNVRRKIKTTERPSFVQTFSKFFNNLGKTTPKTVRISHTTTPKSTTSNPQISYTNSQQVKDTLGVLFKDLEPVFVTTRSTKPAFMQTTSPKPVSSTVQSSATNAKPVLDEHNFLPSNLRKLVENWDFSEQGEKNKKDQKMIDNEERQKLKEILANLGILLPTTTTTTTEKNSMKALVNTLNPEMRVLLKNYGIIANLEEATLSTPESVNIPLEPEKLEYSRDSYVSFKPLPEDLNNRKDMDELFARFGLGKSRKNTPRKEKALKNDGFEYESVPPEFRKVLANLGLPKREIKTPTNNSNLDEFQRLEILLGMIRDLEKLNTTQPSDEQLKKIDMDTLDKLMKSLNRESVGNNVDFLGVKGPNPLDFDQQYLDPKNEFKREEKNTENGSKIVENAGGSSEAMIANLEDSFGGKMSSTTEEVVEETTPKVNTGFYYLADWNSFFDIDDTKGKHVNLRFQPTIGDPKRFISVTVP